MAKKTDKHIGDELSDTNGAFAASIALGRNRLIVLEIPLAKEPPVELTEAEGEIASMLLLGATNQEIADRRGTSVNTVHNQVASIFAKVDVNSRAELARKMGPTKDT